MSALYQDQRDAKFMMLVAIIGLQTDGVCNAGTNDRVLRSAVFFAHTHVTIHFLNGGIRLFPMTRDVGSAS
jgi:hypothetical protein